MSPSYGSIDVHDLLITDARVVDGTGAPAFPGAVAVSDGRIVHVGDDQPLARRTIDAGGRVLAPGFVDLHTHSDFTLPTHPQATAMITQGVTTQVVGNCGFSPFPAPDTAIEELRRATAFIDAGLTWGDWHDTASFADWLQRREPACNVALLVGHGAVRTAVMGATDRAPTPAELDAMREQVADAMCAGAFGLSTGLTYSPGVYADADELHALAQVVADYGGFYASHIRSESVRLTDAVDEILAVGGATSVPVQVSHLKALGRDSWPQVDDVLARIDRALESGLDVLADQYPYTAGSTTLAVQLPGWARADGTDGIVRNLADPAIRERIRAQIAAQDPDDLRAGLRPFDPNAVRLAEVPPGFDAANVGRSIAEVARLVGRAPVDTMLDLLAVEGGVLTTVHLMDEDRVRQIMAHPAVAIASDGWTLDPATGGKPHPRSFGTFTRVLGHYVRDQSLIGLADAVRKMTSLPARRLRGFDGGIVRAGARADLVVFDPSTVADRATFESPHELSIGVTHVVVRGTLVVDDGQPTGARPGVVLRSAAAALAAGGPASRGS